MNVGALFSGGKDSTYSAFLAEQAGHLVRCLITIEPESAQSMLLHHPAIGMTRLQAKAMRKNHIYLHAGPDHPEDVILEDAVRQAVRRYGIEGLVHGGIRSEYQKKRFDGLCASLGLESLGPVWGSEPARHMHDILDAGFRFIITAVSAGGLDDSWLGMEITRSNLEKLESRAIKFGFNLDFEGGEAETLVTDGPMFGLPLIIKYSKVWDGYRGNLEIKRAGLGVR